MLLLLLSYSEYSPSFFVALEFFHVVERVLRQPSYNSGTNKVRDHDLRTAVGAPFTISTRS